jgi:hypothetical protein
MYRCIHHYRVKKASIDGSYLNSVILSTCTPIHNSLDVPGTAIQYLVTNDTAAQEHSQ